MHDGDNRETPQNDRVDQTGLPTTPLPGSGDAGNQRESGYPEPPRNWSDGNDPRPANGEPSNQGRPPVQDTGLVGKTFIKMSADEVYEFEKARKFVSAAQITALISLFIGGIVLSTVSVVLAVIGFRSLSRIADRRADEPLAQSALKRLGIIGIVMAVLALVINIVSLVVFYPMFIEMLQQGNLSGILPGGGQAAPGGSGGTSGTSLFG